MSIFSRSIGIFAILALFAIPAAAQNMGQDAPPPVEVDLTEDEKDAIAYAFVEVEQIQADYTDRFAEIESQEEAQRIQEQLHQEVNEAIEDEGITLELYDQAMRAARTDNELYEELIVLIEEAREERGYEPPQY